MRARRSGQAVVIGVVLALGCLIGRPVGAAPDPAKPAGGPSREELETRNQALIDQQNASVAQLHELEVGFINLLEANPGDRELIAELASFYEQWRGVLVNASPEALRLVSNSADPIGLAWKLHSGTYNLGADLLLAALTEKPEAAEIWLEAANIADHPAWKIVAIEEAIRLLEKEDDPAAPRLAAAAAEVALRLDLENGLIAHAQAMLDGLRPEVRAEIERGTEGSLHTELRDTNLEGKLEDDRDDLLLLSLARNDMAAADRYLAAIRPGAPRGPQDTGPGACDCAKENADSKEKQSEPQVLADSTWYRVLEAWRLGMADPFDLLTHLVQTGGLSKGWNLAAAAVARRGGYPALEAHFLGAALSGFEELTPPASRRQVAPAAAITAAIALEAEMEQVRTALGEDYERSLAERRAALGPDPTAATIDRLLNTPLLTTYTEHAVPPEIAPLSEEEAIRRESAAPPKWIPKKVKDSFVVKRAERQGQRAAIIAFSYTYGGLGHWILLSSDGAKTWSQPYFAGVELGREYRVKEASNLPLFAGDLLRIEVERVAKKADKEDEEGDDEEEEETPTPPATTAASRIYVEIPLAMLTRDSDGDGLTDLAEEALITDPNERDTDHDGIPDGSDPLPMVASRQQPTTEATALAALFTAMDWDHQFGDLSSLDERTQFWIADRQLFTGFQMKTRFIVLTPDEEYLAQQKLGEFFARYITLFVLDHTGKRAYVNWTSQVMGETYRLDLVDGHWRATMVDSWRY